MTIEQGIFSDLDDTERFAMGTNGKKGIKGTINALREILPLPGKKPSWDESQSRRDRLANHLNLDNNPEI